MMNGEEPRSSITLKYQDDNVERLAQTLNHCFDDMEKFVAKIKYKAEQFNQWNRYVQRIGEKKASKKGTKPTNIKEQEFITVLQKVKMAFNTLSRLRNVMQNPKPEDLVHNMFIPLRVIVDASRSRDGTPTLAQQVIFPLLGTETCDLIHACINEDERNLWVSLSEAWTMSSDDWRGDVPPFNPKFSDGWQPYGPTTLNHIPMTKNYGRVTIPNALGAVVYMEKGTRTNSLSKEMVLQRPAVTPGANFDQEQRIFISQLDERQAKKYFVVQDRAIFFNDQELVLRKGECVEVLDNSKQWWKVRNCQGQIGFAPHTILRTTMAEMAGSSILNGKINIETGGVRLNQQQQQQQQHQHQQPVYEERAASETFLDEYDHDDHVDTRSDENGISEAFHFDVADVVGLKEDSDYGGVAGTSTEAYGNTYTSNIVTLNTEVTNGDANNRSEGDGINGYTVNTGQFTTTSGSERASSSGGPPEAYDADGLPNNPNSSYAMFRPIVATQGIPYQ